MIYYIIFKKISNLLFFFRLIFKVLIFKVSYDIFQKFIKIQFFLIFWEISYETLYFFIFTTFREVVFNEKI
jgi:hypothetical protein